jgi:AcrR family transcriptional regulator
MVTPAHPSAAKHSVDAAKPSVHRDDSSTRERILAIALDCFSELGFDGASTRTIATRAGVNQGLIPYYFGSKEALWHEAVDWAFAALHEGLDNFRVSDDSLGDRDRLALLIRRYVRFVSRHPEFVRLMNEEGKRDGPRMQWLVERHVRPLYAKITELYERAEVMGGLAPHVDPLHFHYIFVGAVSALFHQAPECRLLTGCDPADPAVADAHADAVVQLFLGPERSRK